MSKLSWWKTAFALCALCATAAIASPAQTFTVLVNFDGTNGSYAYDSLIQGPDGNLYGTTEFGGANNQGAVFTMTPAGTLTTLYSFCPQTKCADGAQPFAGLVLGSDGNFYGTSLHGGVSPACDNGCGTVFKITPEGTLTTVYSFCAQTYCTDGATPIGAVIEATDGNFYGTTDQGGTGKSCGLGCGTVFKITPEGTLTTLHSFDYSDGALPQTALIQAADGDFYGITANGGAHNENSYGTVFRITSGGTFATLYSFHYPAGAYPSALTQGADGNYYGVTSSGGADESGECSFSQFKGCGTVFKITPTGTFTTLLNFNYADGAAPLSLVQGSNADLYGTTAGGGANSSCASGCGTIFKITSGGMLSTLYSLDSSDGLYPRELFQATSGIFYGATTDGEGGANGDGTVFSLATGLGPFVSPVPGFGKVGTTITILGNNLTGATSVTFNGTAATFTVTSGTAISAVVPSGATTGKIQVTTPTGTLTGNVVFRVLP